MKFIQFVLIALSLSACATNAYQPVWQVDEANKPVYDQFRADYKECRDYAYKAKVAGSRFSEYDITMSCTQRKGYSYKIQQVTDAE